MDIYLTKLGNGTFKPSYDDDYEKAKKFQPGSEVKCSITQPRNLKFHRKFFALLNCTLFHMSEELQDRYKSVDDILLEIKMQLGYRECKKSIGGQEYYIPKSISFAKMDNLAFSEFYSRALDVVLKHFLQGITEEQFESEIMTFL